ncbi:THAP domain-containing protein 1-like isoform X1 [Rhipicephalus microplus]|uniref:THAP domain-containing protein 1 isoform X1 n=1 Tax=Rhipicephalus microplus TaxID=6941 RepID=UPI003F6D710B
MPVCEAWNCDNNSDDCPPSTTFHKFPLDSPLLLKAWVYNVNLPEPWEPTADSALCSDHFLEHCFVRTGNTVSLRPDALPTIFAYPDDRQKVVAYAHRPSNLLHCNSKIFDVVEMVLMDSSGELAKPRESSEFLDHCYGTPLSTVPKTTEATTPRRVRLPEEGDTLRKKLKLARQRVRRLEERVSMLNDMVYSLLNQTIMEM